MLAFVLRQTLAWATTLRAGRSPVGATSVLALVPGQASLTASLFARASRAGRGAWGLPLAAILLLPSVRAQGAESADPAPPERLVRVGIRQDAALVRVACPAGLVVQGDAATPLLEGATAIEVCRRGTPPALTLVVPAAAEAPEIELPVPDAPLTIRPADAARPLEYGSTRYRGALLLQPGRRGLGVVNVLPIEEYLRGVVPAEMPAGAPLEALKAQAVAARTYTVACLGTHRAEGFDLCATTHCQVYRAVAGEHGTTDRAIAETHGQVLLYEGRPITAYFHACCGGATGGLIGSSAPPPYLAGRPDTGPGLGADAATESGMLALAAGAEHVFCSASPEFSWQFERTREELASTFARALPLLLRRPAPLGELKSVTVAERAPSGRAAAVTAEGSDGTYTVRGDGIRRLFDSGRPDAPALRSTRFVLRPIWDGEAEEGPPARYRIIGFGWGHGIGLCQWGAMGMAARGYTAAQILQHYYPGTTLSGGEVVRW